MASLKDNVAVIFKDGQVRIFHGVNPLLYAGRRDVLINPKLPHGIPPHMWELRDGKIEVKSVNGGAPTPPTSKQINQKLQYFILGLIPGILLAVTFYLRMRNY